MKNMLGLRGLLGRMSGRTVGRQGEHALGALSGRTAGRQGEHALGALSGRTVGLQRGLSLGLPSGRPLGRLFGRLLAVLLVAALVTLQALPAGAADGAGGEASIPIVLTAVDDAHVSKQSLSANYGASGSLELADDQHANTRRIYLKFDLGGVELGGIRSGILRLYNNDTRYNRTVSAYETEGNVNAWSEGTITWNNAPAPGPAIMATGGGTASAEIVMLADSTAAEPISVRRKGAKYYELDVTNHLQNTDENGLLSIVIQSNGFTAFASKEFEGGAYPPQLVLSGEEVETPEEERPRELDGNGRSSLYPADWYPGFADGEGRFLHDFSYAGYRMGLEPIPDEIPGVFLNVTEAPYGADNTGTEDVTAVIQQAIDDAGAAGGGVVYLPEGTYRIKPQGASNESLRISRSGVVLRGAGPERTFLFNDEPVMRAKDIIAVTSEGGQFQVIPGTETLIRLDLSEPTVHIPVQDASGFQAGDWVTVGNKYTADFIEEHQMTGWWNIYEGNEGIAFYRKVVAVDGATNTIMIDIPTRYPLKTRDFSSVTKMNPPVTEVGVEHLSIGNVENVTPGLAEDDNTREGTAGYQVAGNKAIRFIRVVDAWARNVHSYRPSTNSAGYDYHILSSGITTSNTRNVTIVDTDIRKPLFRGAGGNGYLYELVGNDNLILNAYAEEGRHNYTFSHMRTSGNVIRNSVSRNPSLVIDFHQYLSVSNLLDGMVLDGDRIEASVRPYPSSSQTYRHGVTTSQTVIWNTNGIKAHPSLSGIVVDSRQHGYGYIIGTRGNDTGVKVTPTLHTARETAPVDFVEGIGQGEALQPQSLYLDQLARRLERRDTDLRTIALNGNPIAGFQPGKRVYHVELPYGTAVPPVIAAAAASEGSTVVVRQATALPGTATIVATSSDGQTSAEYTLRLTVSDTPAALRQIALLPDRSKSGWKFGLKLDSGTAAWLQVTGQMTDGSEADLGSAAVTFESDNEAVLEVSGEGRIEAKAPGTANITARVSLGGVELARSIAVVSAVPVFTELESLPIVAVSSSGDDGNVVENIIDGDYDTRWSASGEGQWAIADLGEVRSVSAASIAFYNGHTRRAIFDLEVSVDGESWTKAYEMAASGNSSGDTALLELFVLDRPHDARYVRFFGYGNNLNAWNSITELRIHPASPDGGDEDEGENGGDGGSGGNDGNQGDGGTGGNGGSQGGGGSRGDDGAGDEGAGAGSDASAVVTVRIASPADPIAVESALAVIEGPGYMLDGLRGGQPAELTFTIAAVSLEQQAQWSDRMRRAVGNRPVVSIALAVDGEAVAWSNPGVPVTVRLPYAPSDAELADPALLEKLTVWRIDARGPAAPVPNARFDARSGSVVFRTAEFSTFAIVLEERSFDDLDEVPWARHEIEALASRGVIGGLTATGFAPRQRLGRAEFTKLVVQALGLSARTEGGFSDVETDAPYALEVAVAGRLGVVNGFGDGSFRPTAPITRQEMMVIAARALRAAGKLSGGESQMQTLKRFADADDIAPYAKADIAALVDSGIIQGSGGRIHPQGVATRAEAAVLLYRLMKQ